MEDLFANISDTDIFPKENYFEKQKWDKLIEAIIGGQVVPVVGPEFLVEGGNLHHMLVKTIARQSGVEEGRVSTFSQLKHDTTFKAKCLSLAPGQESDRATDLIYPVARRAYVAGHYEPSRLLLNLLSIPYFPFVLTTTFTPIVEEAMQKVRPGEKVRTLCFNNDPMATKTPGLGDVKEEADLGRPTVYHMFGCFDEKMKPHSMALTDSDMLRFCRSWLIKGARPETLSQLLQNKYLLVLGCDYSDWLFRFIWYSMKEESGEGILVNGDTPDSLVGYLTRLGAFLPKDNPEATVQRIRELLRQREDADAAADPFAHARRGMDVFISYSRSDSDTALSLYNYLRSQGLTVWYDRENLLAGDKFQQEIERSIRSAKVFVPIISAHIKEERLDAHVYRKEWAWAIDHEQGMGSSRSFIMPVHEQGVDFYESDIPNELQRHNSIEYTPGCATFESLLQGIQRELDKLGMQGR